MAKEYIIGVDGGGTKSDCVLLDTDGRFVDYLKWGTTSHEFLPGGMPALEYELKKMFAALFERNAIDPLQIRFAVLGMAGVDTKYQKQKISEMIIQNGLEDFRVCNDGYLGVKAGAASGVGITIINGTGCSFTGIGEAGEMMQVGGQAVVMDDIGGGYIIGRNIVRLVHRDLILNGKPTMLSGMLMEKVGVASPDDLMDALVKKVDEDTIQIKHLAPMMFEAAHQGDEVARGYLAKMGRQIAEYVAAIVRKLDLINRDVIEVVLIGSAFLKAADKTHIESLEAETERRFGRGKILFRPLTVRPVCGAALWALSDIGRDTANKEFRERVINEIEIHITNKGAGNEARS